MVKFFYHIPETHYMNDWSDQIEENLQTIDVHPLGLNNNEYRDFVNNNIPARNMCGNSGLSILMRDQLLGTRIGFFMKDDQDNLLVAMALDIAFNEDYDSEQEQQEQEEEESMLPIETIKINTLCSMEKGSGHGSIMLDKIKDFGRLYSATNMTVNPTNELNTRYYLNNGFVHSAQNELYQYLF
jgi:hypothetical protein